MKARKRQTKGSGYGGEREGGRGRGWKETGGILVARFHGFDGWSMAAGQTKLVFH